MRAKEFTINVPINIKINGDGDPEIDMPSDEKVDPSELDPNPVFVSPLQQELEMKKAANGKDSDVIDDLTQQEISDDDEEKIKVVQMQETDELLQLLRFL
jgi:hypothetical protein